MMATVTALAYSGFVQLVRTRIFLNILVAGVALVTAALGIDQLSAGEQGRVLLDTGLAFISLIVSLLALVTGVVTVTREIETKQIHVLIARPVSRTQIILGRFLTVAALVVISNLLLGATLGLTVLGIGGEGGGRVVVAALFCSFEGFIIAALAIFFGVRSSSTMSALFTTTLFVLGRLSPVLFDLIERGKFTPLMTSLMRGVYALTPHFFRFDLTTWARTGVGFDGGEIAMSVVYGSAIVVALLLLSGLRLERRDLL